MLLTRKSASVSSSSSRLSRNVAGMLGRTIDRRTFLQALGRHARRRRGGVAAAVQHRRKGRSRAGRRRQDRGQAHGLHALLRRLRDRRRGAERRVDPPGAGVRFADQPRRALREGRFDPRARHDARLAPPEVPDEARRRQVAEGLLGPGAERSQPEAARDQEGERARRDVLDRLLQAQQRAVVPVPQVRVVLRHQQHGPPGAHLPLDHGRRRGEHLGLRRDDELVQRRAEFQVHSVLRQQRGGGASGLDAAHAARQGERRQGDRGRPALHPHRGARPTPTTASAPAPTSRSCGACSTTSSRTAGRTRNTSRPASTAWTRCAKKSRSGRRRRSRKSPA